LVGLMLSVFAAILQLFHIWRVIVIVGDTFAA